MRPDEIEKIDGLIAAGRYSEARDAVATLTGRGMQSDEERVHLAELQIDLGNETGDETLANQGMESLRRIQNEGRSALLQTPDFHYSLGNGIATALRFKSNGGRIYPVDQTLGQEGKTAYLRAIELMEGQGKTAAEVWINLGNLLRIQLGRLLEGIDCYHQALRINPSHAMAMANLGVSKFQMCQSVMGNARAVLLTEAYFHVEDALAIGLDHGPGNYFEHAKKEMRARFKKEPKRELVSCTESLKGDVKTLPGFYRQFCHAERLYLNPLGDNHKCSAANYDPFVLTTMSIRLEDPDAFFRYMAYTNQVKQEFVFCRYLAAQALFRDEALSFVDEGVTILDTLDWAAHNVYVEHARGAYRLAWSILDKVAGAVNEYLKLGLDPKKVHFGKLAYANLPKQVQADLIVINPFFAALLSMAHEADMGDLKPDRELRNILEHRYKIVHHDHALPRAFLLFHDLEGKESGLLKSGDFTQQLLRLLRTVKEAIIYLVLLIDFEERFVKRKADPRPALPIEVHPVRDEDKRGLP